MPWPKGKPRPPMSEETRRKLSLSKIKRPLNNCKFCGQICKTRGAIYCSRQCRGLDPEWRDKLSKVVKNLAKDPEWIKKCTGHNRDKPMSETTRNKLKKLYKGKARTLYGRGGKPSPAMLEYASLLCPEGYEMDKVTIPIPTGSAYKLDFANRETKVNIEIDGKSHKGRVEQDKRRDNYLRSLGWKVIRIPS